MPQRRILAMSYSLLSRARRSCAILCVLLASCAAIGCQATTGQFTVNTRIGTTPVSVSWRP